MTSSANTQLMCLDGFLIDDSTENTGEKHKKEMKEKNIQKGN